MGKKSRRKQRKKTEGTAAAAPIIDSQQTRRVPTKVSLLASPSERVLVDLNDEDNENLIKWIMEQTRLHEEKKHRLHCRETRTFLDGLQC